MDDNWMNEWMNEIDWPRESGRQRRGGWERKWFGFSQEVGKMPGTVISDDVISVAVNEEYSACQRDICYQNLVFCAHFFAAMGSSFLCLLSVSRPICSYPPVQSRNGFLGSVFEFLCTWRGFWLMQSWWFSCVSPHSYFQEAWVGCERGSVSECMCAQCSCGFGGSLMIHLWLSAMWL